VLPVVVTEVLSPETNAYWYVVWMTAWVVFIAPVSVGIALFADAAHRPDALARSTTQALRTSLLLGGGGAVVLAIVAQPVLGLMGGSYADEGVTPLRVLLLAVLPLAVVTAYYAQCRAQERWREALVTGVTAALVGVVATAVAGAQNGLVGMAVTWVVTQTLVACWAGTRLWSAR
jgi:O-antigen/teichoic acid export membrane protein